MEGSWIEKKASKAKKETKVDAHARGGTETKRVGRAFTLGSIAAWPLRWLLQYRRGGNRPITCRLLICSTQTAAVLPPMRKTWTLWRILSRGGYLPPIPDRGFDPLWTRAAIFDRSCPSSFFPFRALIRFFFLASTSILLLLLVLFFFFFFLLQYRLPTR